MTTVENISSVLTNSAHLLPKLINPFTDGTDIPINLGIDKIQVGFVLDRPWYRDREDFISDGRGLKAQWPITEDVTLSVYSSFRKGVTRGFLTYNPSRLIDPHGITCANWEETAHSLERVASLAFDHFFHFSEPLENFDIYSFHLTADFGPISDMERVMRAATKLKPFRGVKPRTYLGHGGEATETVYFKSKRMGQIRIYDKAKQAGLSRPVLRIEFETSRKFHLDDGTHKVGLISTETLDRLFRSRLEPIIQALKPMERYRVDEILADDCDRRTLIELCGRSYMAERHVYPPASQSFQRRLRGFFKKYPYESVEDFFG